MSLKNIKRVFVAIVCAVLFLVVFVFAQTTFTASVVLTSAGVRSCTNISENSDITANINATSSCFSFSSNNILLNCKSFTIQGNNTGTAINITNRNNITVKNCQIRNFTIGLHTRNSSDVNYNNINIQSTSTDVETFNSNTSESNSSYSKSRSSNSEFYNNSGSSSENKTYTFTNVTQVYFSNSTLTNVTFNLSNSSLIQYANILNNSTIIALFTNVTINSSTLADMRIEINDSEDANLEDSHLEDSEIFINTATFTEFVNSTFSNTTTTTTTMTSFRNASFENNSRIIVSNTTISVVDSFVGVYNFTNTTLSISRTNAGVLNFSVPITGSTGVLDSLITIKNDSIKVDSASASHFNNSAKLTFFPQNLTSLEARVDLEDDGTFVSCPASLCENSSTSGSEFIFDVVHFSSFGFGNQESGGQGAGPSGPSAPSAPGNAFGPKAKQPPQPPAVPEIKKTPSVWEIVKKLGADDNETSEAFEREQPGSILNVSIIPPKVKEYGQFVENIILTNFGLGNLVFGAGIIVIVLTVVSVLFYWKKVKLLKHRLKMFMLMQRQKMRDRKHKRKYLLMPKLVDDGFKHRHKGSEPQIQLCVKSEIQVAPPPSPPKRLPPPIPAPTG